MKVKTDFVLSMKHLGNNNFKDRLDIVFEKINRYKIPKMCALNSYTLILNTDVFIKSHLSSIEQYKDNPALIEVYLCRLEDLLRVAGNEELHLTTTGAEMLKKIKNK